MSKPKVSIIGVGNILLGDEGFGIHVIQRMAKLELPSHIIIIDGGTGGIDLMSYLEQADRVIFIDVIMTQSPPGTIFKFTPEGVKQKNFPSLSLHQTGLLEVIKLAELMSIRPRITIIAVQPRRIDWGMELSPELAACVPKVIELALQEADSP